jgi:F-type H+-transporting ATPase subunit b
MDFVTPNITNLLTTAVGFILFVWVLARFAWGPILNLLDARRQKIEGDYAAAEKNLADAEGLKGDFEAKLADIKALERERVQEAVKRGEGIAGGIVEKARHEADETRIKTGQELELDAHKAQLQLRDSVVAMAIGAAEKVIGTKLDDAMHRKLISEYIDEMDKTGSGA